MACGVCMGINSDRCPVCGKETQYTTCPECNGTGMHYHAYDFISNTDTECNELTWSILPCTEEDAKRRGERWIRGEVETCNKCGGTGEVEYEPVYDAYDPDEYHERRLEEKYG